MSRYHSYLNSAKEILAAYKGQEPFAGFVKKFFAAYKKFGSRDRKQISHLCYCYFRLGKLKMNWSTEERILAALFLCSQGPNEVLQEFRPDWNEKASLSLQGKLNLIDIETAVEDIFPFNNELSEDIERREFILSHLIQPEVFLRLRPGKEEIVRKKLEKAGIYFHSVSNNCLALPAASKIDDVVETDKEAVIQDYNSQQTGNLLQSSIFNQKSSITAWDCCAGSGGKSIMLHDLYPKIDLTISDTRESILINLKKRFQKAGITNYKGFVADLASPNFTLRTSNLPAGKAGFELVLADVPCSGSGTWGRTPEQIYFFDDKKIGDYAALQKKIVSKTQACLEPGGYLLYITCSVFKQENEEVLDYVKENSDLKLIKMEVLKGYDRKADTMFAALLHKPL